MFQAYLITCSTSGKRYVGITGRSDLRVRWNEHAYNSRTRPKANALYAAIAKHGAKAFSIESIQWFRSWEDACAAESVLIDQYHTLAPFGYNIDTGGGGRQVGFKPSSESVEQSAAKHRGVKRNPALVERTAAAIRGCTRSTETREKMAASKRGVHRSSETKAKISAKWKEKRDAGAFKTATVYAHRKAASAAIAKIPAILAQHIARVFHPGNSPPLQIELVNPVYKFRWCFIPES